MKFLIEISDAACVQLERAAVEAKAAKKFGHKRGGKKAMAELILEDWCSSHKTQPLEPRLVLPTVKVVSRQKNQKPRESLG